MVITNIHEHEDGSATAFLDLNQEEQKLLIEKGFTTILEEYIQSQNKEKNELLHEREDLIKKTKNFIRYILNLPSTKLDGISYEMAHDILSDIDSEYTRPKGCHNENCSCGK